MTFPAGDGPAGYDPFTSPGVAQIGRRESARKWDGETGDFILVDGIWAPCHPVDQGVALSLCIRRGSIKSTPEVGHTLHEIRYLGSPALAADVRDRVNDAFPLRNYLKDLSVAIDRIQHEERPTGGIVVAVYYRNLRLEPDRLLIRKAKI